MNNMRNSYQFEAIQPHSRQLAVALALAQEPASLVAVEPFQRELGHCEQGDAIACPLGVMDDAPPSVIIACDREFEMRRNYVLAITRPTTSMKIAWRKISFVDKSLRSTTTIVLQQD